MRECVGDLFSYPADAIVIPINWMTRRNGNAVMGAGVAKQAAEQWPWLPRHLGLHIRCQAVEPRLFIDRTARIEQGGPEILGVATKRDWRGPSDLALIEAGVQALAFVAATSDWESIALPRLGCGLGNLDWETQVRPILAGILDSRFVVVHRAEHDRPGEGS